MYIVVSIKDLLERAAAFLLSITGFIHTYFPTIFSHTSSSLHLPRLSTNSVVFVLSSFPWSSTPSPSTFFIYRFGPNRFKCPYHIRRFPQYTFECPSPFSLAVWLICGKWRNQTASLVILAILSPVVHLCCNESPSVRNCESEVFKLLCLFIILSVSVSKSITSSLVVFRYFVLSGLISSTRFFYYSSSFLSIKIRHSSSCATIIWTSVKQNVYE